MYIGIGFLIGLLILCICIFIYVCKHHCIKTEEDYLPL